jgi:hypothetical protein
MPVSEKVFHCFQDSLDSTGHTTMRLLFKGKVYDLAIEKEFA